MIQGNIDVKHLNTMLEFYKDCEIFARKFHLQYITRLTLSVNKIVDQIEANLPHIIYESYKNISAINYYKELTNKKFTYSIPFMPECNFSEWNYTLRDVTYHIGLEISNNIEGRMFEDLVKTFQFLDEQGPKSLELVLSYLNILRSTHALMS